MNRKRCWITGAGGLIGNSLVQLAATFAPEWEIIPITRGVLDLDDFEALRAAFQNHAPQLVIHCAAISKSPACQANPTLARRINVQATSVLADLASEIPLIFFSTDLVFDGQIGNYPESAAVNPLSIYAETKVAAEKVVLKNPKHTVIRTSLNGGISPTGDRGFNEELRNAWSAGRSAKLFTDEFRCPISAQVTARAVWELAARGAQGLYHLAGSERLSRWEIGQLIAARNRDLQPRLEPGSLRDYVGAPRSPDTSLDCKKIHAVLSFPLPGLTAWLAANPNEKF